MTEPTNHNRSINAEGDVADSVFVPGNYNAIRIAKHYIQHPPSLYQDLRRIGLMYWRFIGLMLLGEITLTTIFFTLKERYLWRVDRFVLLALLLLALLVAGLHQWRQFKTKRSLTQLNRMWLVATVVGMASFFIITGYGLWSVLYPPQFTADEFGILVATFGEGPNLRASVLGHDIAGQIQRALNRELENSGPLGQAVRVHRIGLVGKDTERIEQLGQKYGARLIIFGRISTDRTTIDIQFDILQTSTFLDNPSYPQIIPVTHRELYPALSLPYVPGSATQAINAYSRVIAAYSLGLVYYFQSRPGQAIEWFEIARLGIEDFESASISPMPRNIGLLYYYLGKSHQLLGHYHDSVKMLQWATNLFTHNREDEPVEPALLIGQMYNYLALQDSAAFQNAYAAFEFFRRRHPVLSKQPYALYDWAIALELNEEHDAALDQYREIIAIDPEFFIAYLGAAGILTEQKHYEEAWQLFEATQSLWEPSSPSELWYTIGVGRLYEAQNDWDAAAIAYQRAIDLDPEHTVDTPRYRLATAYQHQGKNAEALAIYEEMLRLGAVRSTAHSEMGRFYFERQEYAKAIEQYQKALAAADTEPPYFYTRLGRAYARLNEITSCEIGKLKIESSFQSAFAAADQLTGYVHTEYGHALYDVHCKEDAVAQFEKALAMSKGDELELRWNLAQLYEETSTQDVDQSDKAMAHYQSMIDRCINTNLDKLSREDKAQIIEAGNRLERLGGDATGCTLMPKE